MLIDTHVHSQDEEFASDLDDVMARAAAAGIDQMVVVGSKIENSRSAVELAARYDTLVTTAGVHPHHALEWNPESDETLRLYLARDPYVAAIGEIGLDYHYDFSPRDLQREVFRRQLEIARDEKMPVVVHCREAYDDMLEILKEFYAGRGTRPPRFKNQRFEAPAMNGVMHCFFGSIEQAQAFNELGFLLGIGGAATFSKAEELHEVIRRIPVDRMVLETDAPYMAPVPHRGKRNEPAWLPLVAQRVADLKGLTVADVARVTSLNAVQLFGLEYEQEPVIVYPIRNSLYINLTNRCTALCVFCDRLGQTTVKGHSLKIPREPSVREVVDAIEAEGGAAKWDEIVFCGFGEPTMRLAEMLDVARWLKGPGGARKVRLNTNGHSDLYNKRPTLPDMQGLVDCVSVSLDTPDEETYNRIVQPFDPRHAWSAMIQFIKDARQYIPEVQATAVSMPGIDLDKCRELATQLGAGFRVREYMEVG